MFDRTAMTQRMILRRGRRALEVRVQSLGFLVEPLHLLESRIRHLAQPPVPERQRRCLPIDLLHQLALDLGRDGVP
jgi:hypothetical protein